MDGKAGAIEVVETGALLVQHVAVKEGLGLFKVRQRWVLTGLLCVDALGALHNECLEGGDGSHFGGELLIYPRDGEELSKVVGSHAVLIPLLVHPVAIARKMCPTERTDAVPCSGPLRTSACCNCLFGESDSSARGNSCTSCMLQFCQTLNRDSLPELPLNCSAVIAAKR